MELVYRFLWLLVIGAHRIVGSDAVMLALRSFRRLLRTDCSEWHARGLKYGPPALESLPRFESVPDRQPMSEQDPQF